MRLLQYRGSTIALRWQASVVRDEVNKERQVWGFFFTLGGLSGGLFYGEFMSGRSNGTYKMKTLWQSQVCGIIKELYELAKRFKQ